MNKNVRFAIYTAVIVVCFVSVILAIYDTVFLSDDDDDFVPPPLTNQIHQPSEEQQKDSMEVRVANFKTIFTNQIYIGEYDTSAIQKLDATKDIVYTAADIKDEKEMYEVNIKIPIVNINDSVANEFNQLTQEIFANKANEIMQTSSEKTIYDVEYVAYVNGDILSVVIQSTIKVGEEAQRVIVQTYNYNLKTKQKVTAQELLTSLQYDIKTVNEEIKREVKQVKEEADVLRQSGFDVYERNLEDTNYQIQNAKTYFLGENGAFYVVYAYGNQDTTSEMDIIRFD